MDQQPPSTSRIPGSEPSKDLSIWEALGIAWDLLATVLILTTVFALAGIVADKYFHTKFLCTAVSFALLIIIGRLILLKKAKTVIAKLEGKQQPPQNP